jgi:hypothetical protein
MALLVHRHGAALLGVLDTSAAELLETRKKRRSGV